MQVFTRHNSRHTCKKCFKQKKKRTRPSKLQLKQEKCHKQHVQATNSTKEQKEEGKRDIPWKGWKKRRGGGAPKKALGFRGLNKTYGMKKKWFGGEEGIIMGRK